MTHDPAGSEISAQPQAKPYIRSNFRRFFLRGLTILLPSVLTIWIIIAGYGFVRDKIANPINAGVREAVLRLSPWPVALEGQIVEHENTVTADPKRLAAWQEVNKNREWLRLDTRRDILNQRWEKYQFPLDLIGLVIAVILIYTVGALLGGYIGHGLYRRGERLLQRIPLVRQVYPSVKQVTDFLVGEPDSKLNFNRVVAVEYPRKGLWSVGLVTGDTMRTIGDKAGRDCVTVFVPSSPTPFTGYVITVPREDTIDLNISIEEALRFTISGGVVIPANQQTLPETSTRYDKNNA